MAASQNIVLTVIPAGKAGTGGTKRRFSVHVAPRLSGAAYLSSFPNFVNWAELMRDKMGSLGLLRLAAAPAYTQIGSPLVATRISADPDPSIWASLFFSPGSIPVDDFKPTDFGSRFKFSKYHSYPVIPIHDYHTKQIGNLAIDCESLPPTPGYLRTSFGDLTRVVDPNTRSRFQKEIDDAFKRGDNVAFSKVLPHGPSRPGNTPSAQNTTDHLQLVRFLQPRTDDEYITKIKPELDQPRLDFHRIVASLADHPYVMRLLGLVMDYEIDAGQVTEAGQFLSTSFLQLRLSDWDWAGGTISFPRTALTAQPFLARVRKPVEMSDTGVAKLDGGYSTKTGKGWGVTTLDVEGTAVKSLALADQLNRVSAMATADSPAALNAPAPRSGGMSLVRAGRALDVVAAFKRSSELLEGIAAGASSVPAGEEGTAAAPTGDGVELYAEDLIRGWRVDVHDSATNRWLSLMRRDTRYTFAATHTSQVYDIEDSTRMGPSADRPMFLNEGALQLAITTSANPLYANDDTFVGEALLEWTGWSLVAPRPGRTLAARTNEPTVQGTPYNPDLDLSMDVAATPGSLPRLRYGRKYRFRLRSVNLAGNGPMLEEVGVTGETAGTPTPSANYGRFEPVPAPAVVATAAFQRGETLAELVIKSDDEFDPVGPPSESVRHLLAPAASAQVVELHGMLDTITPPAAAYGLLSAREGLKLETTPPPWQTMMPYYAYAHAAGTKDPNSGDDGTFYYSGNIPLAPWLVDPAAAGIVMSGPEMGMKAVGYAEGPGGWTDPLSSQVVLRGLDVDKPSRLTVVVPPSPTFSSRRFLVEVAKGEQFTVQMASVMRPALRDHFGIVQLLKTRASVPGLPARLGRIAKGTNRVTSPPMVLKVVHAVRKPLLEPKILIATPSVARSIGQTYADFGGRMTCHAQSTSQVDWNLSWSEWADRPGDFVGSPSSDRPRIISGSGSTQPQRVDYPKPGTRPKIFSASGLRHEFGDTKHRLVKVSLTATSRYARYFAERDYRTLTSVTTIFGSGPVQPFSERIIDETDGLTLQRGTDYKIDYKLHLFTLVGGVASPHYGNKVYIEWVPDNVTRNTLPANERLVHVRSSARPAAPSVADVFPLFIDSNWTAVRMKSIPIGSQRVRNGHALRVYLERPWYSSGDDEMLAVILHRVGALRGSAGGVAPVPAGATGVPKSPTQEYTTAWGRDPRVLGAPATSRITASAFPRAVSAPLYGKFVAGLPLPGAPTSVIAVPHAVEYDEEQGLWFSDIQMDLGAAYRPFVRLALARFQPYSLPGCHLSDVVLLDTAQLSPNRTLSVVGLTSKRTVTLSGPMYGATLTGIPPAAVGPAVKELTRGPLIEVSVQFRPSSYGSDEKVANVGWQDVVDSGIPRRYTMKPVVGAPLNGLGRYSVGEVDVSAPDEGLQMRLVVREYERDTRLISEIIDAGDDPLNGYRRRVVWMETFDLL